MINSILLVEDDTLKYGEITKFVQSINNNVKIVKKHSLNSALREIVQNSYEIILLDMSLPMFDSTDSDKFQPYGGLLFLDELKRKKINTPVVIITQYTKFGEGTGENTLEQIKDKCQKKYTNFKEIIYYLDSDWREQLGIFITEENHD